MSFVSKLLSSMNGKLALLTGTFVLGFVAFGTLALSTLSTAKVHGPHYNRVVQNKDLLADVLPPPNYIVETYLTAHLMVNETNPTALQGLVEHYEGLKAEYADRQRHWRENLPDGPLKTQINEASRIPAEAFFDTLDTQLIPALRAGDRAQAKKLLDESLPEFYEKHRASVDEIVSTTISNAEATEAEVAELIGTRTMIMLLVGVGLAGGVAAFAYSLSLSVRRQESEMARIQSMVDQSPTSIMFADANFELRYMNASSAKHMDHLGFRLPSAKAIGERIDSIFGDPDLPSRPAELPAEKQINIGTDVVDVQISAVSDDAGNFLGSMVSWKVITEQLQLEQEVREKAEAERIHAEEQQERAAETDRKVEAVLRLVNQIADGKFDISVPNLGDDAIGRVATALGQAIASVRDTLCKVNEVTSTVATASTEMSSAADEISRGAQSQAARLEETAASLEEITTTVKQNSENAQEARALANGSRDIATAGGDVVGDAVQAMREINDSSKRISDIITTIDEIAFQTNLLALNAAVEAARAGEQGRGFAVVASEVRNLAQRSASSAKEIKSLIQDSNGKVERGTELVNKSGETLGEIVDSVKRVTDIVAEIAAASQEQLAGIQQVTKAVTQMDQLTQSNANQTEELAGTSNSVLDHSRNLNSIVNGFDLGKNGTTATITPPAAAPSASPIASVDNRLDELEEMLEF